MPYVKSKPFYYYLSYDDKDWQKQQAGGSWGIFSVNVMACKLWEKKGGTGPPFF